MTSSLLSRLARLRTLQLVLNKGNDAPVQHVLWRRRLSPHNNAPLRLRRGGDAIIAGGELHVAARHARVLRLHGLEELQVGKADAR